MPHSTGTHMPAGNQTHAHDNSTKSLNGTDSKPGMKINGGKMGAKTPAPVTASSTCTYTVKSGDTLSGIGGKVGVSWQTLAQQNHISNPSYIYVGQKINYPCSGGGGGGGSPPVSPPSGGGSHSLDSTGINLIKGFEGWVPCYYKDPVGYPTIGYGHLIKSGDPYHPGTCLTQAQGEALLASDAQGFVNCVNGQNLKLNQHQFDALVSFAYNLGCGNLGQVSSAIRAGNYGGVCGIMEQYVHAGGQVLQGLVNRRRQECALFSS